MPGLTGLLVGALGETDQYRAGRARVDCFGGLGGGGFWVGRFAGGEEGGGGVEEDDVAGGAGVAGEDLADEGGAGGWAVDR